MELEAELAGRRLRVSVSRKDGRYLVRVGARVLELDLDRSRAYLPSLLVDGKSHEPGVSRLGEGRYLLSLGGRDLEVRLSDALPEGADPRRAQKAGGERLTAPMPGKIVRLLAEVGQVVEAGQGLIVMEAMKMENELKASRAGTLAETFVEEGEAVETGALLARLE